MFDEGRSPRKVIDAMFADLGDWRATTLSKLRALIKQADPEVVEGLRWKRAHEPGGRARVVGRRHDLHR